MRLRIAFKFYVVLVSMLLIAGQGHAAEGGYSNYVPGTFGDFAASITIHDRSSENVVYNYYLRLATMSVND